jgi:hypothetical protein
MTKEHPPQQDRSKERAAEAEQASTRQQDPARNPGPRGNPPIDEDAVARGKERWERVKPY